MNKEGRNENVSDGANNSLRWRRVNLQSDRRTFYLLTDETASSLELAMEPSDVILVKAKEAKSNPVCKVQEVYGYERDACAVSHVALYLGDGYICHSIPDEMTNLLSSGKSSQRKQGGVVVQPLTELRNREIAIARAPISKSNQILIAKRAKDLVGSGYNYQQALACARQAIDYIANKSPIFKSVREIRKYFKWHPQKPDSLHVSSSFICTDFIYFTFDSVIFEKNPGNITLNNLDLNPLNHSLPWKSPVFLPADLFINESLLDLCPVSNTVTDRNPSKGGRAA